MGFGKTFFYLGLSFLIARPFFFHISNFFTYIFQYFSVLPIVSVNFFLITNNQITASFLSYYIAKRLKQGYRVFQLINPLRRELNRVRRSKRTKLRSFIKKGALPARATRIFYNSLFSKSLAFLFSFSKREILKKFFQKETFITYELFFFSFFLIKYFLSNFELTIFSFECSLKVSGILRNIFNLQSKSLFFYRVSRANIYGSYLFLPLIFPESFSLVNYPDYYFFIRELCDYSNNNFSFLVSNNFFLSKSYSVFPLYKAISIGFSSFIRYLRFSIYKFTLSSYYNLFNINRKELRLIKSSKKISQGLLGFKFHLKGRFTRKQIAASYVFRKGRLPLSTINSQIDYSFHSIPLKNSVVGIKVWLYKGSNLVNFSFQTF